MKILALSDVHGRMERLRKVGEAVFPGPDMIVFTGDIVKGKARGDEWLEAISKGRTPNPRKHRLELEAEEDVRLYDEFFDIVCEWGVPTFFVPGNMDAPRQRYFESVLRNAAGRDNLRCVHGLPRLFRDFVVCGVGGEVTERTREDFFVFQTPGWETEHLLSFLPDFSDRNVLLLFHSPPVGQLDVDRGNHKGNRVVNRIIEKYEPYLAFCGHAHNSRGEERIGDSVVINPGSLKAGNYAVVDSETREVEFHNLSD